MSDTTSPTATSPTATCCPTTDTPQPEEQHTPAAPCCGSAQDAAEAQACCAPAAKHEARTAGSTCC